MMTRTRQLLLSSCGLLICLAAFEFTAVDLRIQALFFDADSQHWIWSNSEPVTRFLLYDGAKLLILAFALGLAAAIILVPESSKFHRYRRGMRVVFLSLVFVPAVVAAGKATSNVACPRDLTEFGGAVRYTGIIEGLISSSHPAAEYRCFPAAHASGGFALLSLYFLFRSERNRRRAIVFGLLAGWVMGAYKIAIGDHFLSHTVITMMVAWLVINLLVLVDVGLFGPSERDSTSERTPKQTIVSPRGSRTSPHQ